MAGQSLCPRGVTQGAAYHARVTGPSSKSGNVTVCGHTAAWYLTDDVQHIVLECPRLFRRHLVWIVSHPLCFSGRLCSAEVGEVLYLEGLDIGRLAIDILLSHANIYVGALGKEFWGLGGVADDEQAHHEFGRHVVQTTGQEVVCILIFESLSVASASS